MPQLGASLQHSNRKYMIWGDTARLAWISL